MERRKEVESALLKENVDMLVIEASHGKIGPDLMKRMALEMGGEVHGVFMEKKGEEDKSYILRCMLDKWYNEELFDPNVNGISKLIKILNDVGLKALAHKMKQHPSKNQEDKTGMENTPGANDRMSERSGGSSNARKSSFEKLEDHVGDYNVKTLLDAVDDGDFSKKEMEKFTGHLNSKVKGEFIRAQGEVNFVFDKNTMETMLTRWYEKGAFKLTKQEAIDELKDALEKSGKELIASELKDI